MFRAEHFFSDGKKHLEVALVKTPRATSALQTQVHAIESFTISHFVEVALAGCRVSPPYDLENGSLL